MKILKQISVKQQRYFTNIGYSSTIWGLGDDGKLYYKPDINSENNHFNENDWMQYTSNSMSLILMKMLVDNFYHLLPFCE